MSNIFDNTATAPEVPEILNQFAIDIANSSGLNITIIGGNAIVSSVITVVGDTVLVLTDDAVNYIVLDLAVPELLVDTPTVTGSHVALYGITTSDGRITNVVDLRALYYPATIPFNDDTFAGIVHGATTKGSFANADELFITDSANSYSPAKNLFSTLVSTLAALCNASWNAFTATSATTAGAATIATIADTATKAGIPLTSKSAAYTTVLADANTCILHPTADNNARTFTIDSNANVAYPIGTTLTFANQINTLTIAITSDTLTYAGVGTTGSRTLNSSGLATAIKLEATKWVISGSGLS